MTSFRACAEQGGAQGLALRPSRSIVTVTRRLRASSASRNSLSCRFSCSRSCGASLPVHDLPSVRTSMAGGR